MTAILVTKDLIMADQCVVSMDSDMRVKVDPTHKKIFLSPDKTTVIALDGTYDPAIIEDEKFWSILNIAIEHFREENKFLISIEKSEMVEFFDMFIGKGAGMILVQKDLRLIAKVNPKVDFEEKPLRGKIVEIAQMGETWNLGCGGPFLEGLIAGGLSPSEAFTTLAKRDHWCSAEHTIFDLSILEERA